MDRFLVLISVAKSFKYRSAPAEFFLSLPRRRTQSATGYTRDQLKLFPIIKINNSKLLFRYMSAIATYSYKNTLSPHLVAATISVSWVPARNEDSKNRNGDRHICALLGRARKYPMDARPYGCHPPIP